MEEEAKPFKLRDILNFMAVDEITIRNECNETLIALHDIDLCVKKPIAYLSEELLDREVIEWLAVGYSIMTIKVKGMEDAE